jgi:SAM-dependent methyltransferase
VSEILDRYAGRRGALYRRWRLAFGGYRAVSALLPSEGLIVDLGAGAGLLAHVLVDGAPARRVLAVDHDEARMAALRESARGLPIEAVVHDFSTFEVPACRAVVLVDVLHYLDVAAQDALLQRAALALLPGGVLLLRDPDADAGIRFHLARLHERVATCVGLTKARIGAYRSQTAWAAALAGLGLSVHAPAPSPGAPCPDRIVLGRRRT